MKGKKYQLAGMWLLVMVVVVVLVSSVCGCGESTGTESTGTAGEWSVPVLTVLTGPAASLGLDREWSIKYVADQINAAGGIKGGTIKVTSYDTGAGDAAQAVSTMTQALGTKPLCILGPIDATAAQASGYLAVKEGVAYITAFNSPEELAQAAPCGLCDGPFYADTQRTAIDEWIKLNPDIKSVAVVLTPDMFSVMRDPTVAELEKLGIQVLDVVEVSPPGGIDLGPIATKVISEKPDGYCCMLTGADYARFCKALTERGMTEGRRILGAFVSLGADMFAGGQGSLEDTYIYDMVDYTSQDPAWTGYLNAYKAAHEGNMPYTPANYGGCQMMLALQAALQQPDVSGTAENLASDREKVRTFLMNATDISDMQGGHFAYVDGAKKWTVYMYQITNNDLGLVSEIQEQ
jgi:ABC-type branched-subunit amino acid transport system substrate-binding protein